MRVLHINIYRSGLLYFIAVWDSVVWIYHNPCIHSTVDVCLLFFFLIGDYYEQRCYEHSCTHFCGVHRVYTFNHISFCQTIFQSFTYLSCHQPWLFCLFISSLTLNIVSSFVLIHASGYTAECYWIYMSLINIDILLQKKIFGKK